MTQSQALRTFKIQWVYADVFIFLWGLLPGKVINHQDSLGQDKLDFPALGMSKSGGRKNLILTEVGVQSCKSAPWEVELCVCSCGFWLLVYAEADFLGHREVTTCHPFQHHLTQLMCCSAHDGSSRGDGSVYNGSRDGWTPSQKAKPLKHIACQDNFSHSGSLRHALLEAGRRLLSSVTIWLSCYLTLPLASASGHCHRQHIDLVQSSLSGPPQSWPTPDLWKVQWETLCEQRIDAW